MKSTKLIALLFCIVMLFSLAACTAGGGEKALAVTDHAGRTVELESEAEKLVSGYYITTSMLIAMDLDDRLVGIEAKAASRPIYALAAPELLELPNVGSAKDFNLEGCIALEPDLVILPLKLRDAAETLTQMGIPAICVNPENDELMAETVNMIAALTGAEKAAKKLLSHGEKALADLADDLSGAEAPTVYLGGNSAFLSTAGSAMYQHSLIENAGAINVAAEITDSYWAEVSYEQLLAWDPDYIVIVPGADYTAADVLADSAVSGLSAVKNDRVLEMPDDYESWDSPVPSAFLGSLWLASQLHGDVFSEADFNAALSDFYTGFYGFEPEN